MPTYPFMSLLHFPVGGPRVKSSHLAYSLSFWLVCAQTFLMSLTVEPASSEQGYFLYCMTQPPRRAISYIRQETGGHSDIWFIKATQSSRVQITEIKLPLCYLLAAAVRRWLCCLPSTNLSWCICDMQYHQLFSVLFWYPQGCGVASSLLSSITRRTAMSVVRDNSLFKKSCLSR